MSKKARRGVVIGALASVLVWGVSLSVGVVGAVAEDRCPNAEFRTGPSAKLADCRAYEQVTPPDKSGQDIAYNTANTQASSVGGAVAFVSRGAFAQTASAPPLVQYLSRRTADGWSTDAMLPVSGAGAIELAAIGKYPQYFAFTPDLSQGFLTTGDPAPVAGAPAGVFNLYSRDTIGGGYELLTKSEPTEPPILLAFAWPFLADYSTDGRRVIFESNAHLPVDSGPEAPAGSATNLYEWVDGELRIVGVLPEDEGGGAAPGGAMAGAGAGALTAGSGQYYTRDTMSADGRRVYFTTPPSPDGSGQIYLREEGVATTHVSAPAPGVSDPDGTRPATWMAGTPSGSHAFFTSTEKLTSDATAEGTAADLYRFEVDTGELIDLSVDDEPADGTSAIVQGVLGISADGKRVYFAAQRQIVSGGPLESTNHLYLWEEGVGVRHIAALGNGTGGAGVAEVRDNWRNFLFPRQRAARVTSDGRFATFLSYEPLAACGDGPTPVACPNDGFVALYRYDAQLDRMTCVSCRPDGEQSKAHVLDAVGRRGTQQRSQYLNRYLSEDGSRIFFTTADDLLPERDINGKLDVYLWEDGEVKLMSTGLASTDSYFADASPDGRDVYIATREQLRSSDRDELVDLYNARVGGGFADPAAPAACGGDLCQGPTSSPPASGLVGSISFAAGGNRSVGRDRARTSVRVKRSRRTKGSVARLKVRVPDAGRIQVSGRRIRRSGRSVSKAGTYAVKIALSPRAKRSLMHKKKLKVRARVTYRPKGGRLVSKTARVTFKQPNARRARANRGER